MIIIERTPDLNQAKRLRIKHAAYAYALKKNAESINMMWTSLNEKNINDDRLTTTLWLAEVSPFLFLLDGNING